MSMELLFDVIGWIILRLRYPNKEERHSILKNKYNDSYSDVFVEWPLKLFGIVLFLALLALILAVTYSQLFPETS